MKRYDPHRDVDPDEWQELDEGERMLLVEQHHRRKRIRLPNHRVHAAIHVIVENQVALGESYPAKAVLDRLRREGLNRHEAVHAIGSVLAKHIHRCLGTQAKTTAEELRALYEKELTRLTAEAWRTMEV